MSDDFKKRVIVICGPTGAGKTSGAINIAKEIGGEIIGADSVQVYKYLNIGSAKPNIHELNQIKHHLIDVVEPDFNFSGGIYQEMAQKAVEEIEEKGLVPIVCGGTGLYIRSLINGLFAGPDADSELRARYNELESQSPGILHEKLLKVDQKAGERLHPNDLTRIIRALEVFELTGITITQHHENHQKQGGFRDALTYVINPPKDILEQRIRKRALLMLEDGFVDEVKNLLDMGYCCELRSMQSVGYKQVCDFLKGGISENDLYESIVKAHMKYVKHQKTWFKKEGIHVLNHENIPVDKIKEFIDLTH
jgi:tRNA dimethylallyltransferase